MNKRNIVGCILIAIILFMFFIIYMNKETIFKNKVTINYPDGCVEKYTNNKLMTDECTEGKKLINEGSRKWINNLNQT